MWCVNGCRSVVGTYLFVFFFSLLYAMRCVAYTLYYDVGRLGGGTDKPVFSVRDFRWHRPTDRVKCVFKGKTRMPHEHTHDKHNIGTRWNLNSQCVNRIVCTAAGTCVLYKCRENVFVCTQNFLRRTIITICIRRRLFIKRCTVRSFTS